MSFERHGIEDELEQRLAAAGRFEREVLARAADEPAPGEERAVALARRRLGLPAAEVRARRRWPGGVLAAAAAVVLALVLLRGDDEDPGRGGPPRGTLLGAALEPLEPTGPGGSFARFEWRAEETGGAAFRVRVYDARRPEAEPVSSPLLTTTTWRPDERERAELPDEILWRVQTESEAGEVLATSAPARASRSR
jgi:hypothetical protein